MSGSAASGSSTDKKPANSAADALATAAISTSLKHSTLEDIVDRWRVGLDKHVTTFTKQAVEIEKLDRQMMTNASLIHRLAEETRQLAATQNEIDSNLQLVQTKEKELDEMIGNLEKDVGKLWRDHQKAAGSADQERKQYYDLAKDIDTQLQNMNRTLVSLINKINQSNSPSHDDTNPVFDIIRILNGHLEALVEIDQDNTLLQSKIRDVQQSLRRRHQ